MDSEPYLFVSCMRSTQYSHYFPPTCGALPVVPLLQTPIGRWKTYCWVIASCAYVYAVLRESEDDILFAELSEVKAAVGSAGDDVRARGRVSRHPSRSVLSSIYTVCRQARAYLIGCPVLCFVLFWFGSLYFSSFCSGLRNDEKIQPYPGFQ